MIIIFVADKPYPVIDTIFQVHPLLMVQLA
jgi:hypothetical protein